MNERIIFKQNGIETTEIINTPLTKPEKRQTTIPYSKISEFNPLDLHVVRIIPIIKDGVLTAIELELGVEDSRYHSIDWFKDKIEQILSDGTALKKDEIYKKVSAEFNSSDFKKLKSGGARGYSNLTTSLNLLKNEGKLENPRKGYWKLSPSILTKGKGDKS
jgi:hypothetical protein